MGPLIKSRRTAAREIEHFSCRRHGYRRLQNAVERHLSHQGAVFASTPASFSPQISPRLWATVILRANNPQRRCSGSESAEARLLVGSRRASRRARTLTRPTILRRARPGTGQADRNVRRAYLRRQDLLDPLSVPPNLRGSPGTLLKLASVYHSYVMNLW